MKFISWKKRLPFKVISVVLAGGVGRRLWPISTPSYPKHLSNIFSDDINFKITIKRNLKIFKRENIIVTAGERHSVLLHKIIEQNKLKISDNQILLEPETQNTSVAILYSLLTVKARYGEHCIVSIGPSDLVIYNNYAFRKAMRKAIKHAKVTPDIIILGCKPKFVSSHMGYFKYVNLKKYRIGKVAKFVEKPDYNTAREYIDEGWLWNTGIFVCQINVLLKLYENLTERLYFTFTKEIPNGADSEKDKVSMVYSETTESDRIAIENSIIKKISNGSLKFVLAPYDYNNVGDWTSVYNLKHVKKDICNNGSLANFNEADRKPFYKAQKALGEIFSNFTYEGCRDCFFVMDHSIVHAFNMNNLLIVISKERKEIVISDRKCEELIFKAVQQPDTEELEYGRNLFRYLKDKEIVPCDDENIIYGKSRSIESNGNIVISSGGYTVNLIGVSGLFIAFDKERLLVCPANDFNYIIKKFTYSDPSNDQYNVLSEKRLFHDDKIWSSITFSMTIISIFLAYTSSDYWGNIDQKVRGSIYIFACIFLAMSIIIIKKHQYFEHIESRLLEAYEKEMDMMILHSTAQELYKQFIRHSEFNTVIDSIKNRILKSKFIRRTRAVDMWVSIFLFICGDLFYFAFSTFSSSKITIPVVFTVCWFILIGILCIVYYKRDSISTFFKNK